MKIAITSTGKKLSDSVSELFGRCPYFIIAEIEAGKIVKTEALKNESENQSSGAGMSAAKLLAENNVNAVIAKTIGPRAMDVLKQFNIDVYNGEGKIQNVLQDFIDKKFKK
ncbi:MAG TPA: NifB/NifX family molybdenum-iron cluster-binding protein [Candidatus Moranbacteria bacterium]|nr:NifB/NifX family molybdenum-iron cluster-binding protein [Candidatus Moranbacteria bacterium]